MPYSDPTLAIKQSYKQYEKEKERKACKSYVPPAIKEQHAKHSVKTFLRVLSSNVGDSNIRTSDSQGQKAQGGF